MVVLFPGTSFDVNCENQFMRKYNFLLQSFKIKNDLDLKKFQHTAGICFIFSPAA